jgi:hypothetical protein
MRRLKWAGHVARIGDMRNAHILVGKPEEKRPRGISRHRWEDNIRMDMKKIGWESVDRMHTGGGLL